MNRRELLTRLLGIPALAAVVAPTEVLTDELTDDELPKTLTFTFNSNVTTANVNFITEFWYDEHGQRKYRRIERRDGTRSEWNLDCSGNFGQSFNFLENEPDLYEES